MPAAPRRDSRDNALDRAPRRGRSSRPSAWFSPVGWGLNKVGRSARHDGLAPRSIGDCRLDFEARDSDIPASVGPYRGFDARERDRPIIARRSRRSIGQSGAGLAERLRMRRQALEPLRKCRANNRRIARFRPSCASPEHALAQRGPLLRRSDGGRRLQSGSKPSSAHALPPSLCRCVYLSAINHIK